MKQIKWLLGVLLGAAVASSWWAATMFGHVWEHAGDLTGLWAVPALVTIALVTAAAIYCVNHWEDD